jgi:muramidase (phage lysozyme)
MKKLEKCPVKIDAYNEKMVDRWIYEDEYGFFIKQGGGFSAVEKLDGIWTTIPMNRDACIWRLGYKK